MTIAYELKKSNELKEKELKLKKQFYEQLLSSEVFKEDKQDFKTSLRAKKVK